MTDSKPSARVILDSISPNNVRLTTIEVTLHRFVLAEFNTHRVFSRNSASSRAIPYHKMRNRVLAAPAFPVHWGAEQRGMQSGDELEDGVLLNLTKSTWARALDCAIMSADVLKETGLHKSVINRLIEPFMWHTIVFTASELENFFAQRCHKDAQPEFHAAADEIFNVYRLSEPKLLRVGEWHTPFIRDEDLADMDRHAEQLVGNTDTTASVSDTIVELRKRISVARCARTSYMTHDGIRDIAEDLALYEKLTEGMHMSPFEHVATPCKHMNQILDYEWNGDPNLEIKCRQWGNFYGWEQFRKFIPGENRGFASGQGEVHSA